MLERYILQKAGRAPRRESAARSADWASIGSVALITFCRGHAAQGVLCVVNQPAPVKMSGTADWQLRNKPTALGMLSVPGAAAGALAEQNNKNEVCEKVKWFGTHLEMCRRCPRLWNTCCAATFSSTTVG